MLNIFKQKNPGLVETWVKNLSGYTRFQRENFIRQRAGVITALGLTVEQAIDGIEQELSKPKNIMNETPLVEVKETPFPKTIITQPMPQTQPFELKGVGEQKEPTRTVKFFQPLQQPTVQTVTVPTDEKVSNKKTLKDQFINPDIQAIRSNKSKTANITQRNRSTGVMNQADTIPFKWNPDEVQDRFSMKDYKRPTKSLANQFGPSVEELQVNLPSEKELLQNSDNQIMPKRFHMGKSLDSLSARPTSDVVGTVGFKSKRNLKVSNDAHKQRQENINDM